ncbi:MAG: hypothetical protein ABIT47_03795 [Candidatus Paceibacterota bacterium]
MSLESNPNRAPVPGPESIPTQAKTTNQLEVGDYIVEYGDHLLSKDGGNGNQMLLIFKKGLKSLVDVDEEFHVS